MKTEQPTIQEMFETIDQAVQLRTAELNEMEGQLAEMEKLGIIEAREHWPKDKPGALVLLYFTDSEHYRQTGKRKKYIGKKPERIAEAQMAMARFMEHGELKQKAYAWQSHIDGMLIDLKRAYRTAQQEPTAHSSWGG